jgi:2-polyprenyl-3-methyl-5-hydroxy-6-metoxy-1,4-benzoquinol methylase
MRSENEIAHGYKLVQNDPEKVWGWGTPAGQLRALRRAKMIISGADLKPGLRVLEIGCGTGLFTEMFANTGAHLVAVDISGELLKFAHARKLTSDRVQFLEKRFEECSEDGPFDAVIGSSILHHLEIKDALFEIYSLLKPGGIMCFAEPNMLNPQIFVQKNIPWAKKRLGDSPDETAFVRWSLRSLLLKAGFEKEEIKPFDWLHPATPVRCINYINFLGRLLEKIPVIREFAGSLYIKCQRPKT